MASSTITPPLAKPENDPVSTTTAPPHQSPPSEGKTTLFKQEQHELPISNVTNPSDPPPTMTTTVTATTTSSPQNRQLASSPLQQPQFIDSVAQLRHLSAALSAFQRCYDELHQHLDYINTTIEFQLPLHLQNVDTVAVSYAEITSVSAPSDPSPIVPLPEENPSAKSLLSQPTASAPVEIAKTPRSELQKHCVTMCSRSVRRYMASHLSDTQKLREEVPLALKCAPDPPKLVLECIGKFYLQGSKAYTKKNSHMIIGREVSVLILECFLLMGMDSVTIDPALNKEKDIAAVAWRKRLINEGGLRKSSDIDARGLLFFIGCFGIPNVFKNGDIRDLIRVSNARQFFGALRNSPVLLARIPGIFKGMLKNKLQVEAVDISLTFGLEDKFSPQTILTSFLSESKETWTTLKKAAKGSFYALNEANRKYLVDLKSVIKCLENHKIDPSKLLPDWQIHAKILMSLEKDIANENKDRIAIKRKADETEKLKAKEVKRTKFPGHGFQQHAPVHVESRSSYGILASTNMLDGGRPSHIGSISASPSMLYASGAGSLPESFASSTGAGVGFATGGAGVGLLGAGIGVGISAPAGIGAGVSAAITTGFLSTGSYAGIHGEVPVDKVGYMMSNSGEAYGWRGDAVPNERLVSQSFAGRPSAIGVNSLYGSSHLEGFAGLPNSAYIGVSSRGSTSGL